MIKSEQEFLDNLTIAIDSREQLPYTFAGHKTVRETLPIGDYGLLGCTDIAIERKTIDDLVGSLTSGRERFEKELRKGSQIPCFFLVIEASLKDLANGKYKSKMQTKSVIQTLISWSGKHKTHMIYAGNREFAEQYTLSLLLKYARQFYQKYTALAKT